MSRFDTGIAEIDRVRFERVEADHCGVRRIGHIVRDDWFCPADDFGALDK